MMTKKEAFAGGIRSSQSTVFKNLKKVRKKYYALNKNFVLLTIDVNKHRKNNTKIGLEFVFCVCLSRHQFLYNIYMFF